MPSTNVSQLFAPAQTTVTLDAVNQTVTQAFSDTLLSSKEYTNHDENIARLADFLDQNILSEQSCSRQHIEALQTIAHQNTETILGKFKQINDLIRYYNSVTQSLYTTLNISDTNLLENFNTSAEISDLLSSENWGQLGERLVHDTLTSLGAAGTVALLGCIAEAIGCISNTVQTCIAASTAAPIIGWVALIVLGGALIFSLVKEFIYRPFMISNVKNGVDAILQNKNLQQTRADLYRSQFIEKALLKVLELRAQRASTESTTSPQSEASSVARLAA